MHGMSKRLGHALSVHRVRATQCLQIPSVFRPRLQAQTRSLSVDHQYSSNSTTRSSHDFGQRVGVIDVPDEALEWHLNNLFPPLKFPPELASRILTHASHPDGVQRHNARLSFIGRRTLQSYLFLYLHSAPMLRADHDYERIAEKTLNTYVLGEFVAPHWEIGRALRWTPVHTGQLAMAALRHTDVRDVLDHLPVDLTRSVGLYKVHGATVEAIVGGVFHQFGGAVAHRLFHTRILPHLLLPGRAEGLPDVFHEHAMSICDSMGGLAVSR